MAARSQAGFSQFGTHETSISQREGTRSRTTESDEPDNDLSHVELALPPLPRGVHLTVRHTAGLGVTAGQFSGGAFEHGHLHAEARAGRADRVHLRRTEAMREKSG